MTSPPWLSRALAIDRSGLHPYDALRAALGVVVPLAVGVAAGHPTEGAQAAVGALPVGVAEMTGSFTPPTGLMLTTTAGMSLATFVGSLTAGHRPALVAALAVIGFIAGLLVTLGQAATIVGVQAVVAFLVFGRYPGGVDLSAAHAGVVLAGGLLQTVFAHVLRAPRRLGPERDAIAAAYDRLARLAHGVHDGAAGAPAAEAIAAAEALLERRGVSDREGDDEVRGLVDEARRMRLEIQGLASLPGVADARDTTRAAAGWLQELAHAVRSGHPPPDEPADLPAAVEHLREHRDASTRDRFVAARATALLGQLRAAHRLTTVLAGVRRLPLPRVAGVPSALELTSRLTGIAQRLRLAIDPHGPAFRHAVRLAVLMPVAEVIAGVLPWQRGYWVALTTVVVLKPDYASTVERGVARVAGTAAGVVFAGMLVAGLHPRGTLLVALIAVLAWASYTVFSASFALYTFVLTGLVVLLVSTADPKPLAAVADRGLDTLVGGALALLGYVVWPTPEAPTLRATSTRLLEALADYAELVLRGHVAPDQLDEARLAAAARAARRARAEAQASLDRASAEPHRLRPDTSTAASVLSAARRIVLALDALRTTLQDSAEQVPLPEVEPVAEHLGATLRALARGERPTADLREDQLALETLAAPAAGTPRGFRLAILAAHLDLLVDAVDTMADVLTPHDGSAA